VVAAANTFSSSHERQTKIYLLVKISLPSPSPSWLVLMRETRLMVEGDYDDIKLAMEGLMLLQRRRGQDIDAAEVG
jgi:hypothetical protein